MSVKELVERLLKPEKDDSRVAAPEVAALRDAVRTLSLEVEALYEARHELRLLKARVDGMESILRERARGF